MKRLWLIPPLAAAAIAAGCGSKPQAPQGQGDGGWQTSTDQQGRIVDERQCDTRSAGYRPGLYRWYYYPFGGRPYPLGYGVPLGGTYSSDPVAGIRSASGAVPRANVVRGGFGRTGSGSTVGG